MLLLSLYHFYFEFWGVSKAETQRKLQFVAHLEGRK